MKWYKLIVGIPFSLIIGCGGGGSSSTGTNSNGAGGTPTLTAAEGIAYSKAMVADLVNTQTNVGTSFWAPQATNVGASLQGASLDLTRYGRDLDWLKGAIQQLDLAGGTTAVGEFKTGLWEYSYLTVSPYTWASTEKKWPYTLTKSGPGYTYAIAKGDGSNWVGTVANITHRADGSVLGFTLTNADFPGELVWHSQSTPTQWSYTYDPQGHDVLNLTMTSTGGTAQSATGTIGGYNLVSTSPTVTTTLTAATWDEVATGGTGLNTHAWLPKNLTVKIASGSYSFDGSIDCTNYQANATAALSVIDGPSWGWHALDTTGTTFTQAHFSGKAQNGQGTEADLDFSVSLLNYPALRLDQPKSNSNAPSIQSAATVKLQIPAQPLLTLTVGATTNGLYILNSTLDYTFGTSHITGTGVYYPAIAGQASSWKFTALLKNEKGVQFDLKQDLLGKFSGSVSIQGLTIGTIEDVGFGPRVKYTDGTFQSLF